MYDNGDRYTYVFDVFDFGAAADLDIWIKGPKGKKGRVVDYGVLDSTEIFAGSTNTPQMSVGKSGDLDAYGEELDFGALADDSSASLRSMKTPAQIVADYVRPNMEIPADTLVALHLIGSTGTPTGQAKPFLIIDWSL